MSIHFRAIQVREGSAFYVASGAVSFQHWVWPPMLFPTSPQLFQELQPGGVGSPELGIGEGGCQLFRVNCPGVGVAQGVWHPQNGLGTPRSGRLPGGDATYFARRKGKGVPGRRN